MPQSQSPLPAAELISMAAKSKAQDSPPGKRVVCDGSLSSPEFRWDLGLKMPPRAGVNHSLNLNLGFRYTTHFKITVHNNLDGLICSVLKNVRKALLACGIRPEVHLVHLPPLTVAHKMLPGNHTAGGKGVGSTPLLPPPTACTRILASLDMEVYTIIVANNY